MSLWDWSLKAWRRPGVEAAALRAQDERGMSIALLLWLAHAGPVDEATGRAGARLAAEVEAQLLSPLRRARRALRAPPGGLNGLDAARVQVRQAELAVEHELFDALDELAGGRGDDEAAFKRLDLALGLTH